MTLFLESPCSHGYTQEHWKPGTAGIYKQDVCPGGSRTEIEVDYEAAADVTRELTSRLREAFQGSRDATVWSTAIINTALGLTEGDTG